MNALADYLIELRKGKSKRLVAIEAKISNAYLSQLESGKRRSPHPDVLKKIAGYYGIPVIEFYKKAGYLDDNSEQESYENCLTRFFRYITLNPLYRHGYKIKDDPSPAIKRFIIELHEKITGEPLLNDGDRR